MMTEAYDREEKKEIRNMAEIHYSIWQEELKGMLTNDRMEYSEADGAIISIMHCTMDVFLIGVQTQNTLSDLLSIEAHKARFNHARRMALERNLDVSRFPERLTQLYDKDEHKKYFEESIGVIGAKSK
jgi:hypothetical protein